MIMSLAHKVCSGTAWFFPIRPQAVDRTLHPKTPSIETKTIMVQNMHHAGPLCFEGVDYETDEIARTLDLKGTRSQYASCPE